MKDAVSSARAKIEDAEHTFTHEILGTWKSDDLQGRLDKEFATKLRDRMAKMVEDLCDLEDEIDEATENHRAKFAKTYCSQCGREFGPGNHGFSECRTHRRMGL